MTDPASDLVMCRDALDVLEQQADECGTGRWWTGWELREKRFHDSHADFIAALNPVRVLAAVGSLRAICDGIEATLARHRRSVYPPAPADLCGPCKYDPWPCPDYTTAAACIASLAAVWAPTEQETP